jgi:hypothetical protein
MISQVVADIDKNVMALMSAEDEATWSQVGLFAKVDSLGGAVGSLLHLSPAQVTTLIHM